MQFPALKLLLDFHGHYCIRERVVFVVVCFTLRNEPKVGEYCGISCFILCMQFNFNIS